MEEGKHDYFLKIASMEYVEGILYNNKQVKNKVNCSN